ncbi:MAG: gliding motility-associated C-terminal domain-containing protein [Flavobacteriales bacterium]|nr:gliding motility-associated C-terminal domain-containing protein [Flavobacteriales bacterium]
MFHLLIRTAAFLQAIALAPLVQAQLLPYNTASPQQLVQNMLAGQGISVSNVTFNGAPANTINQQVGSFDGTASNIGLDSGLVLCTGQVMMIQGPNLFGGATSSPASPNNTADPDLGMFVGAQRCVAVLEFDFVPSGDSISFRFVFGSEEYPEYVCSQFNDVFGFFLSGPGINGPFSNQAVNIATVPGTTVPVAINTVNPGTPGVFGGSGSACSGFDPNWQANSVFYLDNTDPDPFFNPTTTVEFDGFTVPLTARAAVQCGQTYHIKLAIAHATDGSLDSAVLIEAGSFHSSSSITASITTPMNDGTLTEGCGEAMVTLNRPSANGEAIIQLTYAGPGITSGDLEGNLAQVTMADGASTVSFPIIAVREQAAEGPEPLTIVATWSSTCGFSVADSVIITLQDYSPMSLTTTDPWLACDQDSVLLEALVAGGLGSITLAWGADGAPDPFHAPGMEDGTYTVVATDQCPESMEAVVQVHAGCTVWIPNVITPNGDGVNDAWVINGMARSGCAVKVYNRWGNMVYSAGNYGNNWKAKDLPDGTYFYEVTDHRNGERFTGHLTVLANGQR